MRLKRNGKKFEKILQNLDELRKIRAIMLDTGVFDLGHDGSGLTIVHDRQIPVVVKIHFVIAVLTVDAAALHSTTQ